MAELKIMDKAEAIKLSDVSINAAVDKSVKELIPEINKRIRAACLDARYETEIDLSKVPHTELVVHKLTELLKKEQYRVTEPDYDDYRGCWLHISWR